MITGIIIGVCVAIILLSCISDTYGGLGTIAFFVICGTAVVSCTNSDWYKEDELKRKAKDIEDAKPRIVRTIDDCNVYSFKQGDRWHYFTKCGKTTTTETTYKESCGKNCSREKSEFITTENK